MASKSVFYKIGSYTLVVLAGIHLVGHFSTTPPAANATEEKLRELLTGYHFDFLGLQRSTMDFLNGFSLSFAAFCLFAGTLNLAVLRFLPHERVFLQTVVLLNIVFVGAQLAIAIVYFIYPPMILLALTLVSFMICFFVHGGPDLARLRR